MIRYKVLQLLLLVSSMTSQMIGMMPPQKKEIVEGISQRIAELPKELRYDIFSSALALRETPKYEIYKEFGVGSYVRGIVLNADNTRMLTGSDDGIVRLWDVEKGIVLKEFKGHMHSITSLALSADGTLALTGSVDGTVRVWDITTGELLKTIPLEASVTFVVLSANGTIALTGSSDGVLRLYNTSTGELLKLFEGHKKGIESMALNADGAFAFIASEDGTARVWNTNTGTFINLQAEYYTGSAALSADGTIALTGTYGERVFVWDAKSGALLNTLLIKGSVDSVALSKDGKRALVGTRDGNIQVWNTQPLPGQKLARTPLTVLEGHITRVTTVAFGSADFIASGSSGGTALMWKPFALAPQASQEHEEVLRQAYKETFSRPALRPANRG